MLLTATMEFHKRAYFGHHCWGHIFTSKFELGMRKSLKDADKARAKLQSFC